MSTQITCEDGSTYLIMEHPMDEHLEIIRGGQFSNVDILKHGSIHIGEELVIIYADTKRNRYSRLYSERAHKLPVVTDLVEIPDKMLSGEI